MKQSGLTSIAIFSVMIFILTGCTDNPFSDGGELTASQISGQITLSHETDFSGIYVWLGEFNISTFTNTAGDFRLSLPPPTSQSGGEGVNGDYKLYFYVANFGLDSATVTILNGDLVRSTTDIDESGSVRRAIILPKLLNVEVVSDKESVNASDTSNISLDVILSSPRIVPVKTVMLKVSNHATLPLPALFLKKVDTEEELFKIVDIGSHINFVNFIDKNLILNFKMQFSLSAGELPVGEYQIIPYVIVSDVNPPVELLNSLGNDVLNYNTDYLQLPFKRAGGDFIISE